MVDQGALRVSRSALRAWGAGIAAVCAVLPLLAPEIWSGFRLAQSDLVLSVIALSEQPLSVRSTTGVWAMLLVLAWFALAYWQRRMTLWEAALVAVGGAAALARLGNAWVFALAMLVPLARQLSIAPIRTTLLGAVAALGLAVFVYALATTRPPELADGARQAALATTASGAVFADWRWAPDLQHEMGPSHQVHPAAGLDSENADFWVAYVRITQGHERWATELQQLDADTLVLDAAGQGAPVAELIRTSSEWRVTYDTGGVLVAQRSTPRAVVQESR